MDLSHDVKPQNVAQAAFVLGQAYGYFPRGTIHLVVEEVRGRQIQGLSPCYEAGGELLALLGSSRGWRSRPETGVQPGP